MTQAIEQAVCDILGACQPVKIILYAEKRTMATDKLKAFSLCIIVPESANCRTLRTHLHLAITVSVPVSLSVYTTEEWAELCTDSTSYAAWIARKGKVICIDETMDDAAEQANLTLLADATKASIAKLQERGGKGFFLMVEGAKIDYAGHSRCLPGSIIEMLSFDLAVAEALKFADRNGETLVVVTADHETGGLVLVDGDERTGRVMGVYVSDDHTPAMLPVFAYGPGADNFCGTYMNTEIARRIKSLIK